MGSVMESPMRSSTANLYLKTHCACPYTMTAQATGYARSSVNSRAVNRSRRRHRAQNGRVRAYASCLSDQEALVLLLGSRYCETDRLKGRSPGRCSERRRSAGVRVQAICDYVRQHTAFGCEVARASGTAWEAFCDRTGSAGIMRTSRSRCVCIIHPSAILHRLSRRYRRAGFGCAHGSQPGSKPISAASGTPLTRATTSRASAGC